jgi:uncharacterized membrane protein YccC
MLRFLIELKQPDVPPRVAIRNTLAVTLPLLIGAAFGQLPIGLAISTGALNTMFADQPGPYARRAERILLTAIAMAASAFVGFAIGAHPVWMVMAGAFWGFAGALLVAISSDAGRVGVTSIILLVVTAATPKPVGEAASAALLIFSGGLLQLLMAVAAWPLQRYRPERTALALVYDEIGRAARERPPTTEPPPVTASLTDLHLMLYGLRRRESMAIQSLRVLAELAERIRLDILALTGLREQLPQGDLRTRTRELLEMAADAIVDIADALRDETTPAHAFPILADFDTKLAAFESSQQAAATPAATAAASTTPGASAASAASAVSGNGGFANERDDALFLGELLIARVRSLGGALRAATRNAALAGGQGEVRALQADAQLPTTLRTEGARATLRANLTFSSVAFRHAVRCGVSIAVALAISYGFHVSHGYWLPMTVAIVLKPDFGGTLSFGLLRILGTIAGLVLTTVVAYYLFDNIWERIFLIALFCYGFRTLTPVHYGIAVTLITAMVVILLSFRGEKPAETVWIRLINTSIGSGLALIAYGVWPTWERHQVRPTLAAMLDSYRRYFTALMFGSVQARADARVAARLARSNAIDSLTRLEAEPMKDQALVELAERVFANANRLVRAVMELDAVLQNSAAAITRSETLHQFVRKVDDAIALLAHGLRDHYAVTISRDLRQTQQKLARELDEQIVAASAPDADPNTRAALAALKYASDRITDPVNTLAHVLREPTASADTTGPKPQAAAAVPTRTP